MAPPADAPSCSTCGAACESDEAVAVALTTWSRGVEQGRAVWTCPECTRRHARAIEGKLDSSWW